MKKRIQDELNVLKDITINTVPVEQIFLFGSYALVRVINIYKSEDEAILKMIDFI